MSIKAFIPGALVVVGLLFSGLPAHAQDQEPVMTLKPMEGSDLPAGSQISEERLQQTEGKVKEFKAQMRARSQQQQQEQQQQTDSPDPNGDQQQ